MNVEKTAMLFEIRFQAEGTTGPGPEMACLRRRKLASENQGEECSR